MDAALPRVADAAVQLHRLADDVDRGCRRRTPSPSTPRCSRRGRRRRRRRRRRATSWRATAIRHQHVGAGVLDRLERADRPAELLAHPRIRHGGGQHGLGQARGCRTRRPAAAAVEQRCARLRRRRSTPRTALPPTAVGGYRCQPAGLVQHRLRGHLEYGGRGTRTISGSPSGSAATSRSPSASAGVGDERGPAVQPPSRRSGTGPWRCRRSAAPPPCGVVPEATACAQFVARVAGLQRCSAHRRRAPRRRGRPSTPAARPICSRTTATSAKVAPAPPSCSGTSSPTQPAWASSGQSTDRPWPADRLRPNAVRRAIPRSRVIRRRSVPGAGRAPARR